MSAYGLVSKSERNIAPRADANLKRHEHPHEVASKQQTSPETRPESGNALVPHDLSRAMDWSPEFSVCWGSLQLKLKLN